MDHPARAQKPARPEEASAEGRALQARLDILAQKVDPDRMDDPESLAPKEIKEILE